MHGAILKGPALVFILLSGMLAGCAGVEQVADETKPALSFESDLFGESPGIASITDIHQLSDEQKKAFQTWFDDPLKQETPAHQRVYDYLESITMDFGYQGETYAAEEALRESTGNCLSLAILTTALAKQAGVETGYQLVDSAPVFESQENVVFRGQHVRTKLFNPVQNLEEGELVLLRGGLLVDYFPDDWDRFVSNLSESEYHAMYFNNLASEAIDRKDFNSAYWLLRKVLELTPENAGAINSMAVVYRHAGNVEKSEEIYKYGIEHLPNKVSLLRNYRELLMDQNRIDEAEEINTALAKLGESSPFDWLHAGHDAYNNGDYRDAVSYYKKAVEIAPYLHESYAGMAKAYYMLGYKSSAKREFQNAQKMSYQKSINSLYQAKLMALASE